MSSTEPNDPMLVYVTAPDNDTARRLAQALVAHCEAACVNIVAGVESVYRWQGRIETDAEWLLMIKTRRGRLTDIDARLAEQHPDDVPERIATPIVDGGPDYIRWLIDQTQ